VDKLTDNSN